MARLLLCFLVLSNLSCATGWVEPNRDFDFRKLKIQMVSLFNQHTNPQNSHKTWRGDWLFRRERLAVMDRELSDLKPDLAIFQNMMRRDSNPFESDEGILSAGALRGYRWSVSKVFDHTDTGEEESLGLAFSSSFEIPEESTQNSVVIEGTALALQTLKLEHQAILIANIDLADKTTEKSFEKIIEEIKKKINTDHICPQRIIFAIHSSRELEDRVLQLADKFSLQDSAKGFCNTEADCFTAGPANKIYNLVYGETLAQRVDFLFVPAKTFISKSERNMTEPRQSDFGYFKQFGLEALWPSDRYGWRTDLTLARCQLK